MRPLATWLVVGGLAVLGLFAVRDTFRGAEAPASSPTAQRLEKGLHPRLVPARPPRIVSHDRLAGELRALGAEGVLYVTDASCRRFLLGLPDLVWATPEGLPGPNCTSGIRPVVDERFGIAANQVAADIIEARSADWRLRFEGNDPAFTPDGMLTFLRAGRLFAWTLRCPPGVRTTTFEGSRVLERCARPVKGAPERLREVVWLSGRDYAALAGQEDASSLLVVRNGRTVSIFKALGVRMGALEASPGGRYLAARLGGGLVVFDSRHREAPILPAIAPETRAIAWSPNGRYAAVASPSFVRIFRSPRPTGAVNIPLAAFGLDWR